jgi:ubiquinone/menaquinone biosynthesis C-methylase UbiE
MDIVRKRHNNAKRNLINSFTSPGDLILDVGCGCGGDLMKWNSHSSNLIMIDPSVESVEEARQRAKTLKIYPAFYHGTIENSPSKKYDVICFNFSLQYVFDTKSNFLNTMNCIKKRSKTGTRVFGCIPDSDFIMMNRSYEDSHGNIFVRNSKSTGMGQFGESIKVRLEDTPYYGGRFIGEPIAYKDRLVTWMENHNFRLVDWSPLVSEYTNSISDLYSKFCFLAL